MINNSQGSKRKFTVVSNRLPVVIEREGANVRVLPGKGGLVTALAPILKDRGGTWIGWDGDRSSETALPQLNQASSEIGYRLRVVKLAEDEIRGYYEGFSNETIWPLFHDHLDKARFSWSHWKTYLNVNAKFAEVVAHDCPHEELVWIHDYHLIPLASQIKKKRGDLRLAFFLHIPFPPLDLFYSLPWRNELIRAMLDYDLVGFQTERDRRNFINCVRALVPQVRIHGRPRNQKIEKEGHATVTGAFPISIDFKEFDRIARSEEVAKGAWFLHERFPRQQIVLGVDRLDYTKGITCRFTAFEKLLQEHPELCMKIVLIQICVPSRENVPEYQAIKSLLEEEVGRINGRFSRSGWVPIHYRYKNLPREELVTYYNVSEIALITPLKDGMNLIAKEYCASCFENNGVLILSEFAGASQSLKTGALLVNPYNTLQTAEVIHQAYNMPLEERNERMIRLRAHIRRNTIFHWVEDFLSAVGTQIFERERKAEKKKQKVMTLQGGSTF